MYLESLTELEMVLNEWRFPNSVARFEISVKQAGSNRFTYLMQGRGTYEMFISPRIMNQKLYLQTFTLRQ